MKDIKINHAFNLEYYTPCWWERVILAFTTLETHEYDGVIVTYKRFRNRLYIHNIRRVTHLLNEPSNGGVNKPWTN